MPHTYPLDPTTVYAGARTLSRDAIKEASKRLKALEKRDENKKLTDEAKNSYEELIYEMRGWLNEDENEVYVKSEDKEALLEELEQAEDWLYGDGSDLGYKEYQSKQYDLNVKYTPLKTRKAEHLGREEGVPMILEKLQEERTAALEIREKMPWVTEEEQQDLVDKIEETIKWIEDQVEEQSKKELSDDPVFTSDQMQQKLKKYDTLSKKINGKKKPKEKKQKKPKEDEEKKKEQEEA